MHNPSPTYENPSTMANYTFRMFWNKETYYSIVIPRVMDIELSNMGQVYFNNEIGTDTHTLKYRVRKGYYIHFTIDNLPRALKADDPIDGQFESAITLRLNYYSQNPGYTADDLDKTNMGEYYCMPIIDTHRYYPVKCVGNHYGSIRDCVHGYDNIDETDEESDDSGCDDD